MIVETIYDKIWNFQLTLICALVEPFCSGVPDRHIGCWACCGRGAARMPKSLKKLLPGNRYLLRSARQRDVWSALEVADGGVSLAETHSL